jgi:peptide/nickel transport system substrate-binding protein
MRVLSTRAGRCGVLLVGIVFSLLCFGEAALAQKRGGVLRMFHRDNPPSTSILEEFSPSTVVPFMPVFNNLVVFDPLVPQNSDKSIVPDLAESWSWNDDKTELTFKLRRGVKWHDGWAFTAADVECTFNLLTGRARDKLRNNPRGSWYGNINYVHGSNDYEVTIHLNHPQPSLLTLLASGLSPIYPCHVPSAQMRIKPIGTGPFKVDSFKQFDSVRLVRNPDYFKPGKPHLDGIEFHIVSSPSTAMLSFVAGRFDITFPWEVTIPQLRDIRRQSPRAVCETTSMNNNTNILVNREAAPFDKPEIRRALSLALDRRAFIAANEGDGQIGGTMQPPSDGMWGLSADKLAAVPGYGPDVEKNRQEARAIMGRAGFSPEKRMRTKVQTRALSVYRNPATILVDQLREIHVDAELDVVEASHWFPKISRKDYTIGLNTTGNGVDDPDQAFFENFSCRSERNYNGYCNGEIERLFERQSSEPDPDRRRQMVWEIDARLLADGARPTIMWNRSATCWQPYVKGYVSQVNSMFNAFRFEDVWLDR